MDSSFNNENLLLLIRNVMLGDASALCHLRSGQSIFDVTGTETDALVSFLGAVNGVRLALGFRHDSDHSCVARLLAQNAMSMTALSSDGLELVGSGFAFIGRTGSQSCIAARFYPSVSSIVELPSYQLNRTRMTQSVDALDTDVDELDRIAAETIICPDFALPIVIAVEDVAVEGFFVLSIPAGKASLGELYLFAQIDELPSEGVVFQRLPATDDSTLVPIGRFENLFER